MPTCTAYCSDNLLIEIIDMSKNFTKRDLVLKISKETGQTQETVFKIVQKALDYLNGALAAGNTVEIRNFGVFEVRVSKPRIGRNPNKPATDIPIPSRPVVRFKPGKEMRELVEKLDASKIK